MLKYAEIINRLTDDVVYSPGTIPLSGTRDEKRARIAFTALAKRNAFPSNGDAVINLPGQAPIAGWFGWRWKTAIDHILNLMN